MIGLERFIKYLIEHKLNVEQHFVLELLYYRANQNKEAAQQWIIEYKDAVGVTGADGLPKIATAENIQKLIADGWIEKPENSTVYVLTKKVETLFVDAYVAGFELFEAYPSFGLINGVNIPLQVCNRIEVYHNYWNAIRASKSEHKEILLDIEYAATNGLLSMNIAKFVASMYWIPLRRGRATQKLNTTAINQIDHDF